MTTIERIREIESNLKRLETFLKTNKLNEKELVNGLEITVHLPKGHIHHVFSFSSKVDLKLINLIIEGLNNELEYLLLQAKFESNELQNILQKYNELDV